MVSVPTSLFGVLGFVILAAVLFGLLENDQNPISPLHIVNDQNTRAANEMGASFGKNTTGDWGASIINTGGIVWLGFQLILGFLLLPFVLFAQFLISISLLPAEFEVVGIFIGVGLVAGVAIFIRKG